MRRSLPIIASLLLSSLAMAFVLSDGPLADGAGAMVAVGHLVLTTVTVVGALVGAARWSLGLGLGLAAAAAVVAVTHTISPAWVVMVGLAAVTATGLLATGLRGTIRLRPRADGPPAAAVALPLGLLAAPIVVGASQPDGVDLVDWVVVAAAAVVAVWYTRAGTGALWAVRVGCPALAVAAVLSVPAPQWVVPGIGFAALSCLAWTSDARIAVQPIAERGTAVPIPPELAPKDILDAAGIDDRGRRKDTQ